jgi:4-hydroxybenzoate polyprenyltransferase
MLMLRLMDELKDKDTDRRLFPERPLPSGRVRESDIGGLLIPVAVLYVPLHAGTGLGILTALVVLAYALLMFRWFFLPEILRPRLLLTLATHTPIIPLLLLHLVAVFAAERRLALTALHGEACTILVLLFWSPVLGWEIERKIRVPREENAYVTYSKIFGAQDAVLFALAAQTLGVLAGARLYWSHGFSTAFLATIAVGYVVTLLAYRRFLARPSARTARLAPVAELNVLSVLGAGLLA